MPTCPKCQHKWGGERKVKQVPVSMGRDPGPARWVGDQGEEHEGGWCDPDRYACAEDASLGLHPDECPCTWCASRRARGWVRKEGEKVLGRHSGGWDYPGMDQFGMKARYAGTDWKAFREAQRVHCPVQWSALTPGQKAGEA